MRGLVLLHGFLGGSWSYDRIVAQLKVPRSVLTPTIAYHGPFGERLPAPHAFNDEVNRLARVIEASALAPVDLVGYSLGGRLALGIGTLRPDLLHRLILISSRRGLDTPQERAQRAREDERWAQLLESEGRDAFLARWWSQPLFRSLAHLPPETRQEELERRGQHDVTQMAAALRCLGLGQQPSYAMEARRLKVPTTLVVGALDEKFLALCGLLACELPCSRSIVVEGAGHQLLLEAPGRISEIIDEDAEQ